MRTTHLLAVTVALVLPLAALAKFSDVDSSNPFANAITYVESTRIASGYSDGTFRPNNPINRAEFTKIIVGSIVTQPIVGCSTDDGLPVLSDVPKSTWFADYVCTARKRGIVDGYADKTFKPTKNVISAEAAKIAVKTFGFVVGVDAKVWYRPYMEELKKRGVLPTSAYDPNHTLTRGEMAEMIYRLKNPGASQTAVKKCVVAGCSGQLCVEEGSEAATTCEWRDEYMCYKTATCGRIADGSCGWQQTAVLTECLKDPSQANPAKGSYIPYQAGAIGNGKTTLLFFHASWCPYCRTSDKTLADWYGSQTFPITTYKVDYDAESELKKTYGVVMQHTFVLVDGTGKKIRSVTGPSDEQLKSLLAGS